MPYKLGEKRHNTHNGIRQIINNPIYVIELIVRDVTNKSGTSCKTSYEIEKSWIDS